MKEQLGVFNTLNGKAPLIIGHRGSPGFDGENTLAGYRRAVLELDADGFEIDIRLTKDNELVACHDIDLNRIIGEQQLQDLYPDKGTRVGDSLVWYMADFKLEELQKLKVTYPAPGAERLDYKVLDDSYRMPAYSEILDCFLALKKESGKEDLKLYTELVPHPDQANFSGHVLMSYKLIEALAEKGFTKMQKDVWLQSFDFRLMEYLSQLKELLGFQKTQLAFYKDATELKEIHTAEDFREFVLEKVCKYQLDVFHIWKVAMVELIQKKNIDVIGIAHGLGVKIHLFTFDDTKYSSDYDFLGEGFGFSSAEEEYRYFFEIGVDAVMSDFVLSARKAREQKQELLRK